MIESESYFSGGSLVDLAMESVNGVGSVDVIRAMHRWRNERMRYFVLSLRIPQTKFSICPRSTSDGKSSKYLLGSEHCVRKRLECLHTKDRIWH